MEYELTRREFIRTGLIGGTAGILSVCSADGIKSAYKPTPPESEGPFYPVMAQKDKDFDLTLIKGRTQKAKGQIIIIEGRVLDSTGKPISDAAVDLWQANTFGRYQHPRDAGNTSPVDPNFQGWAIVPSGEEGAFRFKTIFPGTYPGGRNWIRPPHIHFKIGKKGYRALTTQMYFPGQKLNDRDYLLNEKSSSQRGLMIAKKSGDATYKYDIVLAKK